jgi:Tfp pilus assembly protein PilF
MFRAANTEGRAMRKLTKILSLVPLTTMLVACGPTGETAKPGEGTSSKVEKPSGHKGAGGKFGSPTEEAKKEWDAAIAKYKAAKADGALAGNECSALAEAFWRLYDDYGDQMRVAAFNAGAVWDECGDSNKAESYYNKLGGQDLHLVLNNKGVIAWKKGKHAEALSLFDRAVASDRVNAFTARNNQVAASRDKYVVNPTDAAFNDAEKMLRNVLAVDSSNKLGYENLARLYYDRGRLKDSSYLILAQLVYTQGTRVLKEQGEKSAALENIRGLLYMEEDNQVDALRQFKAAVAIEPDNTDANLNIAFISIRFRAFDVAEKALAVAMKDPAQKRNPEAYIAMGVAKRGMKQYAEAEKFLNEAAKLDSKDPRPAFNLGVLYNDHKVGEEGIDLPKTEKYWGIAKGHYGRAISTAGGNSQWKQLVEDAKLRTYSIDEGIKSFREAEKLAKQAAELEAAAKKAEEEERKRLLELEAKAAGADSAPEPAPTPAPAPAAAAEPAKPATPAKKK